jgi:phosphoglycerol transferase MdoB-like AlkP superfamily enzyme
MLKWRLVIQLIKNFFRRVWTFVCDQYLILFFILTIGLKLAFFNAWVINVTWPTNQYQSGVILGFLSVAVILSPLYFASKHKNKLAILSAFLISVLILADTIYFSYFAALPSVESLDSLGQTKDLGPAIGSLLHWWFLLYFFDIALAIIFLKPVTSFFKKIKDDHNLAKRGGKTALAATIVTLIIFWLALVPMSIIKLSDILDKGYDTVSTAQYYGLLGAHAVDIARFIEEETTHLSTDQQKTVVNWVKKNQPAKTTDALTGTAKGKNVIIVQVESLGGFVINQKVDGQAVTPNLDQLAQTSQFFPNDRFVIGAGHTSDTDFVVNSSYFPLTDAATFVRYGQDDFTSLPKALVANGYSTNAYHGFNRNFWNRDVALESLGYQKFYAADDYPKGAIINLGLNDGDFLSKTAEFIKDQPKPSLSYAITLSSHVPFAVTDQTKGLNIKIRDYPYLVGGYLEDINYTDRMLGNFFAKLKSEGLYDNSLILVYGDHTPVLPSFTAGSIKYDPTTVQEKEVPLFVKLPSETVGKTYPGQGTHLDIMSTVLDLLGVKTSQLMFGQSLFADSSKEFQTCPDQIATFKSLGNCNTALATEKNMSKEIIRYNLFNILPK